MFPVLSESDMLSGRYFFRQPIRHPNSAKNMQLRYPKAKQDVSGKMTTQGSYAKGYPQGAIVHFTAGRSDPLSTVKGGIKNNYTFFVIGPDGQVYQNFDLNRWGSHAGKSSHQKLGEGVSRYLVGIEICNAGKVRQIDSKTFRPWYNDPLYYQKHNKPIPKGVPNAKSDLKAEEVRFVERFQNREAGWYHCYTPQQEKGLIDLLLWLKSNAPNIFSFEFVLGHDEVSPGRKNDPGGSLSMTMPEFRARLIAMSGGEAAAPKDKKKTPESAPESERPRLRLDPKTFLPEALSFQKAANLFPGIKLIEDGYAGPMSSDAFFLLTGYYLKGDKRAKDTPVITSPVTKLTSKAKPLSAKAENRRLKICKQIVKWEGRYKDGKLQVYTLPSNDGGGKYEVAGINEKYHPEMAKKLAALIKAGKHDEAEEAAAEHIAKFTDTTAQHVKNAGVEAFLRDTAFNRGNGGAAKILQIALSVTADGKIGPITKKLLATKESTKPVEFLQSLRDARETYERDIIGYRANFWQGLVNRWNKAHASALEMIKGEEAKAAAAEVNLALSSEATLIGAEDESAPSATFTELLNPALCYAPAHFSKIAQRFQEYANHTANLDLEEDGLAGKKSSDAFRLLTGYYLAHDPRIG